MIVLYIVNVISAMVAITYMDHAFAKRYTGYLRWMLFLAGVFLYFGTMEFLEEITHISEPVRMVIYSLVLFLYSFVAQTGKIKGKILISIAWMPTVLLAIFLVYALAGLFMGVELSKFESLFSENPLLFLGMSVAAAMLRLGIGYLIILLYHRISRQGESVPLMLGVALLLIYSIFAGIFLLESGDLRGSKRSALLLILLLLGLLGIWMLYEGFRQVSAFRRRAMITEFERKSAAQAKESLDELYQITREVNRWRHDMSAELSALYLLEKGGNHRKVEEKLSRLNSDIINFPKLPSDTGNEGLNAALIRGIVRSRREGVQFRYVVLGDASYIDSFDMVLLVDNLLKNCIEAAVKVKGGVVDLMIRSDEKGILIRTENSISLDISHKTLFESTKEEPLFHGFGLETIHEITEKYKGKYLYRLADSLFVQKICLNTDFDRK